MAGVSADAGMDGVEALPLLRAEAGDSWREKTLIECLDNPRGLRLKTLVVGPWKLMWYAGQGFGELYDLAHDPRERVNQWTDRGCATEREWLLRWLLDSSERLEN